MTLTAEDDAIQHRTFEALRITTAMLKAEQQEQDASFILPIGFRVAVTHDVHYTTGAYTALQKSLAICPEIKPQATEHTP